MAQLSLREQMRAKTRRDPSLPFSILFVCTGNICRSPLAEQLFAARIAEVGLSDFITVSSAGTQALTGQGMPEQSAILSAGLGADPTHHRARDITPEYVNDADLILALAREHRSGVVRLVPRAAARTYTLIEFSRLMQSVANEHVVLAEPAPAEIPAFLRDLVERAASRRGLTPTPEDPEADDVLDPYRRSQQSYDLSAQQIVNAGRSIVSSLEQIVGGRR